MNAFIKYILILVVMVINIESVYSFNIRYSTEYYNQKPYQVVIVEVPISELNFSVNIDFVIVKVSYTEKQENFYSKHICSFQNRIHNDTIQALFTEEDFKSIKENIGIEITDYFSHFEEIYQASCLHDFTKINNNLNYWEKWQIDIKDILTPLNQVSATSTDSKWLDSMWKKNIIPKYTITAFKYACKDKKKSFNDEVVIKVTNVRQPLEYGMVRSSQPEYSMTIENEDFFVKTMVSIGSGGTHDVVGFFSPEYFLKSEIVNIGFDIDDEKVVIRGINIYELINKKD